MIGTKSNQVILEELSDKVYGHLEAKKVLINLVNKARLRYYAKWGMLETVPKLNNNCLLIGPSGTGKTFLVEQLKELCPFPFLKFDATQIQPDGNGSDFTPTKINKQIKKYLQDLIHDQSFEYAASVEGLGDQLVIFIDEIDKLANSFDSTGNWNKQIQANLLTTIENSLEFDGISFVFAGAFVGLEENHSSNSKPIGFFNDSIKNPQKEISVEESLIKYGLIPEFVGRIGTIVKLDKLTLKDYEKITNNYIIPNKIEELKLYYRLTDENLITKEEIENIIQTAFDSELGVRGIKREIDKLVLEKEFNYENLTEVVLLPTII